MYLPEETISKSALKSQNLSILLYEIVGLSQLVVYAPNSACFPEACDKSNFPKPPGCIQDLSQEKPATHIMC